MFLAIAAVRLIAALLAVSCFLVGLGGLIFGFGFWPGKLAARGKEGRIASLKLMGASLVILWAVSLASDVLLRLLLPNR